MSANRRKARLPRENAQVQQLSRPQVDWCQKRQSVTIPVPLKPPAGR